MKIRTRLPYMIVTICFTLALLMFIFSLATPVDAAAVIHGALP
jgi:hypothetical protein